MVFSVSTLRAWVGVIFLIARATVAAAAQTVALPGWVCTHPDSIYVGGFEDGDATVPSDPSNGSGGATGSITRQVHVTGLGTGTQTYYLYVPTNYSPSRAWPILLVLHGTAPYPDTYAATTRDDWIAAASAGEFIVAAPVAHSVFYNSGCNCDGVSWRVPPSGSATDYDEFAAIRADLEAAYNIERTRIYGWGFSAGGRVMHDLGVNTYSAAFNASTMAAYSVSSGDLAGLACQGLSDTLCNQALDALPRKIPVDIHIGGNSDPNFSYAQADYTRFVAQGWTNTESIFYTSLNIGHMYEMSQLSDIWRNLCPNAVIP